MRKQTVAAPPRAESTDQPRPAILLLGEVRVLVDGERIEHGLGARALELLCYLAIHRDRSHSRERLMTVLWPEKDSERGSANLRRALFLLRRGLGESADDCVVARDERLQLAPGVYTDLLDLSDELAQAEAGEAAAAVRALDGYTGDLLGDRIYDWSLAERELLRRRVLDVGRDTVARLTDLGAAPEEIVAAARLVLELDPSDEATCVRAILARGALGDRSGAAAAYDACCTALAEDLGVEPSLALTEALETALAFDPLIRSAVPHAIGSQPEAESRTGGVSPTTLDDPTRPLPPPGDRKRSRGLRQAALWTSTVAAVVTLGLLGALLRGQRSAHAERTANELVNEHLVASYMEDLPVRGSEPDVVDEWLNARVDYLVQTSPGAEGFSLYGGGLCDLAGEIAATTVYRASDDERISVFTFPEGDLPLPSAPSILEPHLRGLEHDGFSIVFDVRQRQVRAFVSEMELEHLASVAAGLRPR